MKDRLGETKVFKLCLPKKGKEFPDRLELSSFVKYAFVLVHPIQLAEKTFFVDKPDLRCLPVFNTR